jgi:hypothetical protein
MVLLSSISRPVGSPAASLSSSASASNQAWHCSSAHSEIWQQLYSPLSNSCNKPSVFASAITCDSVRPQRVHLSGICYSLRSPELGSRCSSQFAEFVGATQQTSEHFRRQLGRWLTTESRRGFMLPKCRAFGNCLAAGNEHALFLR